MPALTGAGIARSFPSPALLLTQYVPEPVILQHLVRHGACTGGRRTVCARDGMRDAGEPWAGVEVQAAARLVLRCGECGSRRGRQAGVPPALIVI